MNTKDYLEIMKNFWFAPLEIEFEYHEQRSHINDIFWLIEQVEKLNEENSEFKKIIELRGKKIIKLQNELYEQSKEYEELLDEKNEENSEIINGRLKVKIFDGRSALKSTYQYRDWACKQEDSIEIISVNISSEDTVFVTFKDK